MRVINFFGNSMAASLLESLSHLFISQYAPRKNSEVLAIPSEEYNK